MSGTLDSAAILNSLCNLTGLLDRASLDDYWRVGLEKIAKGFGAEAVSLIFLEPILNAEKDAFRIGLFPHDILQSLDEWESSLEEFAASSMATGSEQAVITAHVHGDYTLIHSLIIADQFIRGAISFVITTEDAPMGEELSVIYHVVQLFAGNGLRVHYLADTDRQLERTNLFYLIAQDLTRTLDLNSVLNQTTQMAASVLNAQAATLFRTDLENDELIFTITKGTAARVLEEKRMPMDSGVAGYVARHGTPLIVNDTTNHVLFNSSVDSQTGFTTENILCVPLRIQERTVGVLEVMNKEADYGFTDEDEKWLTTMGHQVAIALENAALFAREQERVVELATLNAVSQTINSELDVSLMLDKITHSILDISAASRSELLLLDPLHQRLDMIASAGYGHDQSIPPRKIALSDGLVGLSARENSAFVIRKANQDSRYVPRTDLPVLNESCMALVPLTYRDEVAGVIIVYAPATRPFDDEQLELLKTFANQAAIALQNAELYQNLRAEQERIIKAQEEVRHQLARDLHDNTAQMLSLIIMNLDMARGMLQKSKLDDLGLEIDGLENLARQANQEVRTLLFELRPIIIEHKGLVSALKSYYQQLQKSVDFKLHLDARPLKFQIELQGANAIFSIIQEAVNNIRKHAKADNVWVRVQTDDEKLYFSVEDDGQGFDYKKTTKNYAERGSFGLLNMTERTKLLNGTLKFASPRPDAEDGTLVSGYIPLLHLRSLDG